MATMAKYPRIPHEGHISVELSDPTAGPISIPIGIAIEPNESETFAIWFKLDVPDGRVLTVRGKLLLTVEEDAITSEPFTLVFHPDS